MQLIETSNVELVQSSNCFYSLSGQVLCRAIYKPKKEMIVKALATPGRMLAFTQFRWRRTQFQCCEV